MQQTSHSFQSLAKDDWPLLQSFFELWGEGSSFEAMAEQLRRVSQAQRERYGGEGVSWKIVVDKWGAKLRQSEQIALINKLAFLGFTVQLHLSLAVCTTGGHVQQFRMYSMSKLVKDQSRMKGVARWMCL